MKRKQVVVQNFVAKHAYKSNRASVHENKKRKENLQYWRNQPKSSLNDLI